MKFFTSTCSLIVLACFVFCVVEDVSGQRVKRSMWRDKCPEEKSDEECKAWAEEQSKTQENACHKYELDGHDISWQDCGKADCGENTKLVVPDLSKPYPECCEECEVVDPSKPAKWSVS